MRKVGQVLVIVIFVFFMGSCEKDERVENLTKVYSSIDDSEIKDSDKDHYNWVASIWANKHRTDDEITIPEELYSRYYNALVQIHNAEDLYYKDSISEINYSTFPYYSDGISYLYLEVDSNESWYNAWIDDSITTGNDLIDQLITMYKFETINYLNTDQFYAIWSNEHPFFQLRTSSYVNMEEVAKEFGNIQGITYSKDRNKHYSIFVNMHYSSSYISITDSTDRVSITYFPGQGWTGKTKWWKFATLDNGIVEFVEKY
ncbi:MAG: hypothetical protein JKX95_08070 [Bacteroidia bacterium]|nr:hypothetical protein [Bacteroidia bacterium]